MSFFLELQMSVRSIRLWHKTHSFHLKPGFRRSFEKTSKIHTKKSFKCPLSQCPYKSPFIEAIALLMTYLESAIQSETVLPRPIESLPHRSDLWISFQQ